MLCLKLLPDIIKLSLVIGVRGRNETQSILQGLLLRKSQNYRHHNAAQVRSWKAESQLKNLRP